MQYQGKSRQRGRTRCRNILKCNGLDDPQLVLCPHHAGQTPKYPAILTVVSPK